MEEIILLIVALGALGAIGVGMVLLYLYFRAGRAEKRGGEPVVYGNLVQCPNCGYMNPLNSAACLHCRQPLPRARAYQPPPPADYDVSFRPTLPPQQYTPPMSGAPTSQGYLPPAIAPAAPIAPAVPAAGVVAPAPVGPTVPAAPLAAPAIPGPVPVPPNPPAELPPGMPRAWFECIGGVLMGHTIFLEKVDTLVGRSTQCDIQVYDPKVSRRHFMIRFSNQTFFLQDQQSSRGTMINGERVNAQKLNDGDRVEAGDTSLIFHIHT